MTQKDKTAFRFHDNDDFEDRLFQASSRTPELPELDAIPKESYERFLREGIGEVLEEFSPVEDLTGDKYELHFLDYYLEEPKFTQSEARDMDSTYETSLRVETRLVDKETDEMKEQEIFFGDVPLMTDNGAFIVNGVERFALTQVIRATGVLFNEEDGLYSAKVFPDRGAWLVLQTNRRGYINLKIDRGRKTYITTLLRAFGIEDDEELIEIFSDVDDDPDHSYIKETIEKDPTSSQEEAFLEIYKKMRPGDLATAENAQELFEETFKDPRRYDLGRVGRYKLNRRLGLDIPNDKDNRLLTKEDLVAIVKELIRMNNEDPGADDVDHLKNRRVRGVGEQIRNRFRTGVRRVERIIRDKLSTSDEDTLTPAKLVNARPVTAILQEYFGTDRLSQIMDQTNPLAELEHKRRISALGRDGLSRERAGFEVRDVHRTHYGRICPVQTSEGQNIGLITYLATYAQPNEYGLLETPYFKVINSVPNDGESVVDHQIFEDVKDPDSGKVVAEGGVEADADLAEKIAEYEEIDEIPIKAEVTDEITYLNAHEEDSAIVGQSDIEIDENNRIQSEQVPVRIGGEPSIESIGKLDYIDVSPKQIFSVSTSLIPFVEHDAAERALMGSNMQRQAVPLVKPQVPLVGTGMEAAAAKGSGRVITAPESGEVSYVDGKKIEIEADSGEEYSYDLKQYERSNKETPIHQKPIVDQGDKVEKGEALCDGPAIKNGKLALGSNLITAFMAWEGGNFEDAVIISERLVKDDVMTSVHIKREEVSVRDTKLGEEIMTRDIPNVSEEAVADLDEDGIIRIGAEVESGDILVGKITPKGETELTAEEKLLRAIFGDKAKDVKDSSLKVEHGGYGKVIDVKVFDREEGADLDVGVLKKIYVYIAQKRKIKIGDKLAGRHGNKGVIAKILPEADMPFLEDGTPVDIILNPLGVVSRMNIGQILETHLGWAAAHEGYNAQVPAFEGIDVEGIREELSKAGLSEDGKVQLYDGRTGEAFEQETTVGIKHILKLEHMIDDKMHARSTGPYSLVTQQPLGGKAQMGGQRFGEMEVWALEGHGSAYALQEMVTIKSDDVPGRSQAHKSIVRNQPIEEPGTPEAFNVAVREMQGLGLSVDLLQMDDLEDQEVPGDVKDRYEKLQEIKERREKLRSQRKYNEEEE